MLLALAPQVVEATNGREHPTAQLDPAEAQASSSRTRLRLEAVNASRFGCSILQSLGLARRELEPVFPLRMEDAVALAFGRILVGSFQAQPLKRLWFIIV